MATTTFLTPERVLMSLAETAQLLGISEKSTRMLALSAQLVHLRVGRKIMFRLADLREWQGTSSGRCGAALIQKNVGS
jgi:excisionase family DNA binding protein